MANPQIENLERVATLLANIPTRFIFTGGATIVLYVDEIVQDELRPTLDVDCVVEVYSMAEYYKLTKQLRNIGLEESTAKNAPICRWQYNDLIIDIMPCDDAILGFTNRWYSEAINNCIRHILPNGQAIEIFAPLYLLASKVEAFKGRGKDLRLSKDIEDIIILLDSCSDIENEFIKANQEIQEFLKTWFQNNSKDLEEAVYCFLPDSSVGREQLVMDLIDRLSECK